MFFLRSTDDSSYTRLRVGRNAKGQEMNHALFNPLPCCRQIFDLEVELVQTFYGTAVPLFDYVDD